MLIQSVFLLAILLVSLGAFISPELKTYALQIITLLTVFSILIKRMEDRTRAKELSQARKDEQTLLFLSTEIKPDLEKIAHKHESQPSVEDVLEKISHFIQKS